MPLPKIPSISAALGILTTILLIFLSPSTAQVSGAGDSSMTK